MFDIPAYAQDKKPGDNLNGLLPKLPDTATSTQAQSIIDVVKDGFYQVYTIILAGVLVYAVYFIATNAYTMISKKDSPTAVAKAKDGIFVATLAIFVSVGAYFIIGLLFDLVKKIVFKG
jgi:hypothetical protein